MTPKHVALMVSGDIDSGRDALTEEKYKDLAGAFSSQGFEVKSVLYNEESIDKLATELLRFDAVLVWVNPVEQGKDRQKLDVLLAEISDKGCFVSTHPEVILKIGTKDILFKTKEMGWGCDTKLYTSYEDFTLLFPESLGKWGIRVLKQYRGNGGNGVYKIINSSPGKEVTMIHAIGGYEAKVLSVKDFYDEFKPFFHKDGLLIDQEWNNSTVNGMVRCYLSGAKVAGFGYQEINALYEIDSKTYFPPSRRHYFTENCGLFSDLRAIMENVWVPQLQGKLSVRANRLPVIWDADFFINDPHSKQAAEKYTLCEINVSCVSPFPPSSIKFIVDEVRERIDNKQV